MKGINMSESNLSFTNILRNNCIYHSPKSLIWYFKYQLFKNIFFENKKVLDIGGGIGLTSFYAAINGAAMVDLVEPLEAGSGNVNLNKYYTLRQFLPEASRKIQLHRKIFQEFTPPIKYDIVILHNSINHLDENACINLLKDTKSYGIYKSLIKKIYDLMNNYGTVIIADCSNKNFFYKIGLKSPLVKEIEWEKHHTPETWISIFKEVGFQDLRLIWTSPKQLRMIGSIFLSNKFIAYFLFSHFIIHFRK